MSELMGNNNAGGGFRGGGNSHSSSGSSGSGSGSGGGGSGGHRGTRKDIPVPVAAMSYQPAPTGEW